MVLPKNRSTKYRKITKKVSKGTKVVYLKRKKIKVSCAICKSALAGITAGSKTEKSVSRKFGGHLCQKCTTYVIKEASRVRENIKSMENVDLIYKRYIQQLVK